ncbi:MAG: LuxR family transcriptional regulator [Alphaproteobacteria bacterium HGW-Alphaproteobacteria-8]|nr:MAG: LuxR family transcriptional regulator [Alphaproteobacteria bacterium HGW-Alphaproteobacteria-8]
MTETPFVVRASRQSFMLAALMLAQGICATFFVIDVIGDVEEASATRWLPFHTTLEVAVTVSLVLGVVLGGWMLRDSLRRQRKAERGLSIASGAFADVLETFFDRWGLTLAERDIAMMSLKGLSVADMAAVRGAAAGTVRAQCASVYAKAGVSGRPQLLSIFIDELLGEQLIGAPRLAA